MAQSRNHGRGEGVYVGAGAARHRRRVKVERRRRRALTATIIIAVLVVAGIVGVALVSSGVVSLPSLEQGAKANSSTSSTSTTSKPSLDERADTLVASMTLDQKVAQLLFVAPESLVEGVSTVTQAGDATREGIEQLPVGGIILFSQNLLNTDQTKTMLANMSAYGEQASGVAPFLGVDEEGGTVSRIGGAEGFGVSDVGNMSEVGQTGDASRAREVGSTVGGYLSDLGFTIDFAPVADVANNPQSDTMELRSFGSNAQTVAEMVAAEVEGFSGTGVLCCAKHFPGIGGAVGDSHNESITSDKTFDEMAQEEFVPFQAAIKAGVPFVMVGHLTCEAATGSDVPASLNPNVYEQLRNTLGFDGIAITDSLSMASVTNRYADDKVGVMALQAGADMILMPSDVDACYQGILDAVASGELSEERINESVRRIVRAKLALEEAA